MSPVATCKATHTSAATPHTNHEDPKWRDRKGQTRTNSLLGASKKQPQFAQPILRNTRKGRTVAAVRTESDDEKRWMEGKVDREKKREVHKVSWTLRKLFPCPALVLEFDGAAVLCHL